MKSLFLMWTFESVEVSCERMKALLGIDVSDSWSIGEQAKKGLLTHKANGVKIEERIDRSFDVEESLQSFIGRYEKLVALALKNEPAIRAALSVVVYSDDRAGLFLGRDLVRRIAETASDFDYDFYPLDKGM